MAKEKDGFKPKKPRVIKQANPRSEHVMLVITPEELDRFSGLCKAAGVSKSEGFSIMLSGVKAIPVCDPAVIKELRCLIVEISRLGNTANQLARHANIARRAGQVFEFDGWDEDLSIAAVEIRDRASIALESILKETATDNASMARNGRRL